MPLKELDNEGLQNIRNADAGVGEDAELSFYPPCATHRRQLLRRLEATEEVLADKRRLVRELDVVLNGEDGAAQQASLCDIVAQLRHMKAQSIRKTCPHGYAFAELATGAVTCGVCTEGKL